MVTISLNFAVVKKKKVKPNDRIEEFGSNEIKNIKKKKTNETDLPDKKFKALVIKMVTELAKI